MAMPALAVRMGRPAVQPRVWTMRQTTNAGRFPRNTTRCRPAHLPMTYSGGAARLRLRRSILLRAKATTAVVGMTWACSHVPCRRWTTLRTRVAASSTLPVRAAVSTRCWHLPSRTTVARLVALRCLVQHQPPQTGTWCVVRVHHVYARAPGFSPCLLARSLAGPRLTCLCSSLWITSMVWMAVSWSWKLVTWMPARLSV